MGGRRIGRFVLGPEIASGGMASVHLGRMQGAKGFGKTVAMKRLHEKHTQNEEFTQMFHDEVRLTSRLNHPNIVMTLDVIEADTLYLVMEYVHGIALSQVYRALQGTKIPHAISVGILAGILDGLDAAHTALDETGTPLKIIHRDVSPQNVLISFQGVSKLADFGIARATNRAYSTQDGSVRGKVWYMAPEQLTTDNFTSQVDVYAVGALMWECLSGRRMVRGETQVQAIGGVLRGKVEPPSTYDPNVPAPLDAVVMKAVERDPTKRFATAREMATAVRAAIEPAHPNEIGEWLKTICATALSESERKLAELNAVLESESSSDVVSLSTPDSSKALPQSAPSSSGWLRAAGGALVGTAIAGGILIFLTRARHQVETPVMDGGGAVIASASVHVPTPTISSVAQIETPEPVPTASAPKPIAAQQKKRCRIVTTMDPSGRTKFSEVCQ